MMNKDAIKDRVLTENTAQGILNHLRELESNRARMQTRWIWELLQNARDASVDDDTQLVASIEVGDDELVFQHNGRGFTMEEVAHLIYHGSTKFEDKATIGQYGSGFLTTHLLSPEIDVSGQLNDGRPFNFRLKREISSAQALSQSMDQAWNEFDASAEAVSHSFTTRFRYPIREDTAGAVEEGIDTLKRCAPFVVVFNRQFRRIEIDSQEGTVTFEVLERVPLTQEGLQTVTVGISDNATLTEGTYLLAEGERVSVAIPLEPTEDGSTCLPLGDIPRLFLGFPLIGTETFSFPAVINSFAFTPTEHRDGVFLAQGDDKINHTNQAVIEEACRLQIKLISFVTESCWSNIYRLVDIPPINEQTWLNVDWLQDRLKQLVQRIRQTPAVLCWNTPTVPEDSIMPFAVEAESVETLWDLVSEVGALRQKLPNWNEAAGWCKAVQSWAAIVGREPTLFTEAFNGKKLVSYVEKNTKVPNTPCGTLDNLRDLLNKEMCAIEWLNQLYAFLKDNAFDKVLRESYIVLDQAGYLDKLPNLYRDNGIDVELKGISDNFLELGVRIKLRHNRLTSLADEIGKGEYNNEDVVEEIIGKLQELCSRGALGDAFAQASARLLAWIVTKQELNYLTGFPAFSIRPEEESREVLWLGQKGGDDAEIPLAPVKAWAEDLQQYADLFPWRYILADDFFDVISEADTWQMLSEKGYVRTDVVIRSDKSVVDFLPDEPLADGDHSTIDAVTVTDLVFLTKDRDGIMARVRDSQVRARLFWRFLTEWLVTRDVGGLEYREAKCECGESHRYLRAMWLVPVVRNNWVPQGNNIRDRATAQSLATLLRDSDWSPNSLSDDSIVVKLLGAIRVTRFDLMRQFVVDDDESQAILDDAMTSILASTDGDLSDVRDFAEDMEIDKELPQIYCGTPETYAGNA